MSMGAMRYFVLAALAVIITGSSAKVTNLAAGNVKLIQDESGAFQLFYGAEGGKRSSILLAQNLSPATLASAKHETMRGGVRVNFGANTKLEVTTTSAECSSVTWTSTELPSIQDCISYGDAHWYGGFEQKEQKWPINKLVLKDYDFVTKEEDNMGVAERYFLNSYGDYIFVEKYVPLFIDANATGQNDLCLTAKFQQPYMVVPELRLHYRVCSLNQPRLAQLHAIENIFGLPSDLPDERMVQHPIWSTWVRYKRGINQTKVLNYASEITGHGYNHSQIEIDDDWETCYGELVFDQEKFPDPAGMVSTLKEMGFRVTLWMHPFMNENCPSFDAAKAAGHFAKDEQGNTRTGWWNGGKAAIVDFTNPEATQWFLNKVRAIQQLTGMDSFKFDAGETSWLPKPRILSGAPDLQPNIYTQKYVHNVSEFGPLTEIRTGFETQDLPLFVRMVDKDSRWGMDNGLRSVVTTLLAMNLAGYPYILPDMIGGNSYSLDVVTKELFVRWLQASTFMPSLQFSYVPWDFDDPEIEAICKKFVDLHAKYSPAIMNLARNYKAGGTVSINNPIWMAADVIDETAFTVDDEYLLGRTILVAPVMEKGAVARDVYLPEGVWKDLNTGQLHSGRSWLRDYPAPLDTLPYFELVQSISASVSTL